MEKDIGPSNPAYVFMCVCWMCMLKSVLAKNLNYKCYIATHNIIEGLETCNLKPK